MYLGAFGEVRMCVHRETGAQRAVKVLRKSHMDDDEKKMLFNEINILRELVRSAESANAAANLFILCGGMFVSVLGLLLLLTLLS